MNKFSFLYIASSSNKNEDNAKLWHTRLSHIVQDRLVRLAKIRLFSNLSNIELPTCESCLKGKLVRKPFAKANRAQYPLQLIVKHLWTNEHNGHGAYYFITFIDDYTRYGLIYLVTHNSNSLDFLKRFMNINYIGQSKL